MCMIIHSAECRMMNGVTSPRNHSPTELGVMSRVVTDSHPLALTEVAKRAPGHVQKSASSPTSTCEPR